MKAMRCLSAVDTWRPAYASVSKSVAAIQLILWLTAFVCSVLLIDWLCFAPSYRLNWTELLGAVVFGALGACAVVNITAILVGVLLLVLRSQIGGSAADAPSTPTVPSRVNGSPESMLRGL